MTLSPLAQELYATLPAFHLVGNAAYEPGLERIGALCAAVGNPERRYKTLHVAGTNGKGTVCHLLAAILQARYPNECIGLYTSPHLVDFGERMRVKGQPATEAELQALHKELKPNIVAVQPSFFEYITAMAFLHFARKGCSWVVLETGLGGRLDATNVTIPELAIVTTIALDHVEQLGPTRAHIAREKAGIFKTERPALIGERDPETEPVFTDCAEEKQAALYFAEERMQVEMQEAPPYGWKVTAQGKSLSAMLGLQTDIQAPWQLDNLRTALAAIDLLAEQEGKAELWRTAIYTALPQAQRTTGLRGRLEWVAPDMLLDVAHNPAGMQALRLFVEQLPPAPLVLVLGLSGDKDIEGVLAQLPRADWIVAVQAHNPRAYPAAKLAQQLQTRGANVQQAGTVAEGLASAKAWANRQGGKIIVTGSLFVVGEVLSNLANEV